MWAGNRTSEADSATVTAATGPTVPQVLNAADGELAERLVGPVVQPVVQPILGDFRPWHPRSALAERFRTNL